MSVIGALTRTPLAPSLWGLEGGFTPLALPGLAAWYDASDPTTLFQDSAFTTPVTADADPVGGWQDKSGLNRHLTQTTAGKRPLYKTAIVNGLPVIRFDGTDDAMLTALNLDQPCFLAGVAVLRALPAGNRDWFSTTADLEILSEVSGNWRTYAGVVGAGPAVTVDAATVLGTLVNGAASKTWKNSITGSADTNVGTINPGATIYLASYQNASGFLQCDWAELIICQGEPAAGFKTSVFTYLAAKYGVTMV